MTKADIVEALRRLSNVERLELIEVASRMVQADLDEVPTTDPDEDPVLRVAGTLQGECPTSRQIDDELYGSETP